MYSELLGYLVNCFVAFHRSQRHFRLLCAGHDRALFFTHLSLPFYDRHHLILLSVFWGPLYAIEIPRYFAWIERYFDNKSYWNRVKRALLAEAFFNPLWIARHIALIKCFSGQYADLQWNLLNIGWASFIQIAPFAIV